MTGPNVSNGYYPGRMTRSSKRTCPKYTVMKNIEKKILTVWRIEVLLAFLLLIGPLMILPVFLIPGMRSYGWLITPVTFILFALSFLYVGKKYSNWGYEMREDHLYLEHGVIKKVKSMAPYVRIQHVDTQRGPLERLVGLSRLVVYTAGSRGADLTIPALKPEDAERMQEKLRDVAIESEDRDAV